MGLEEVGCYYGEVGTRNDTRAELRDWIRALGSAIGKPKVAKEANAYAQHMLDEGFNTCGNILLMTCQDLIDCGMRRGDADALMRSVVHIVQTSDGTQPTPTPNGVYVAFCSEWEHTGNIE